MKLDCAGLIVAFGASFTTAFTWSSSACAQPVSDPVAGILADLIVIPGVSGREERVREAILENLPRWARDIARVDAIGNLIVSIEGDGPSVLYVAHMDETGHWVTNIRDDGFIQVQSTGGMLEQIYQARALEIHTSQGPVDGVVVTPSVHLQGSSAAVPPLDVADMLIDVGTNSREETLALGVRLLDPITVPKTVQYLAGTRVSGRSMDDRFGCSALVALAQRISPNEIEGSLTLAWSVQEELGLIGAEALADHFSPDFVIPVDTYVTADSPVESPRIGNAALGEGPIIRALDRSNIAPFERVRALLEFAENRELRLRYGATGGGNDGSVFRSGNTSVIPLAIPIRYAHTPVETIDVLDLVGLVDILEAMVRDTSWTE